MFAVDNLASNKFNLILLIRHPIRLEKRHGLFFACTIAVVESVRIKTSSGNIIISS